MSYSFDDYQKESHATAKYPVIGHKIIYPTLGLLGETGEIAEKLNDRAARGMTHKPDDTR